ncbi:MAG: hypothetical protein Q8L86_16160 [Vicinamibacterales bacterium]|nr:hypothetical protein [Vicinamibacterales bacterium]
MKTRPKHPAFKIIAGLFVVAGLGYLFVQTLDDARSEPFTVRGNELESWTVAVDAASLDPAAPVVSLRPPRELPMRLFRQLFSRVMETLNTPQAAGIPLALASEVGGRIAPEDLAVMARVTGMEAARLEPRCLAHRRIPEAGVPRQLYYLVFEVPGFAAFRQALGARLAEGATEPVLFDAAGLEPILMLASSHPEFARWLPVRGTEADCIAPVIVE